MWLFFGIGAIVCGLANVYTAFQNKKAKGFRFLSLSLTALTVCALYADGASRVVREDWAGLTDIMPIMSKVLWFCVVLSILLNSLSLFKES